MKTQPLDLVEMGERIRKRRKLLGMTREQLAEALDVSSKFIADIECGSKGLSLKRFCKLAQILGISTDYLLTGNSQNPRKLICEVRYYVE